LPKPPVYEALSYVWGDPNVRRAIVVSDERKADAGTKGTAEREGELQVTENLHSALQYLRLKDWPRVLWVDAVCIYSHRTTMKYLETLRFPPQFFEGFHLSELGILS
jgi:hypothetical protein